MSTIGYVSEAWNAICDVCGLKYKSTELTKRWDGLMVCSKDFEHRHPQDLIRVRKEEGIPWSRPEPENQFVDVDYVDTSIGTQDNTLRIGTFNNDI